MTRDDIIRVMREVLGSESEGLSVNEELLEEVLPFLQAVAAAEREACAVAAWSAGMDAHNNAAGLPCDARETGAQCAAAIRSRSNQ